MSTLVNKKNNDSALIDKSVSGLLQRELRALLIEIIEQKQLTAYFQPIILLSSGKVFGYEGLIRGPSDSPLHSPLYLFHAAREFGLLMKLESTCRQVVLEAYMQLNLDGKLFLNITPECFLDSSYCNEDALSYIQFLGLNPNRIVIELTESQPIHDYQLILEAVRPLSQAGAGSSH